MAKVIKTNNENLDKFKKKIHIAIFTGKIFADNNSPYSSPMVTFLLQKVLTVPGFMVDIRALANDNFLSESEFGFVMADSATSPPNKFMILPVVDGQ
jgi:hypothetical protein